MKKVVRESDALTTFLLRASFRSDIGVCYNVRKGDFTNKGLNDHEPECTDGEAFARRMIANNRELFEELAQL